VKIADYGLGKAFEAAGLSGHTRTGQRAGSPWFMPRQQVINFKYCKPDVDVYGMAASLYYMLTGFHPRDFPKGKDPWQVVLQTKPVPVAERGTSIPPKLASFLDKSLDDSKTLCFSTIEEFRKELKAVISK
jgi:serine/threonine-protein kinase